MSLRQMIVVVMITIIGTHDGKCNKNTFIFVIVIVIVTKNNTGSILGRHKTKRVTIPG